MASLGVLEGQFQDTNISANRPEKDFHHVCNISAHSLPPLPAHSKGPRRLRNKTKAERNGPRKRRRKKKKSSQTVSNSDTKETDNNVETSVSAKDRFKKPHFHSFHPSQAHYIYSHSNLDSMPKPAGLDEAQQEELTTEQNFRNEKRTSIHEVLFPPRKNVKNIQSIPPGQSNDNVYNEAIII